VGEDLGDAGQIGGGELDVGGVDVLLDALGAAGAGNGRDVLALGEQPGQRALWQRERVVRGSGSGAVAAEHEGDGFVHDRGVGGVGRDEVGPYELGPQELAADHPEELFGHRGCRLRSSVG